MPVLIWYTPGSRLSAVAAESTEIAGEISQETGGFSPPKIIGYASKNK